MMNSDTRDTLFDADEADYWMDDRCPWSLDHDFNLAQQVTRKAARIALDYFKAGDVKQWDKSHNNPVSEADIAVDDYLRTTLLQNRPGYGWLSEETEDRPERLKCGRLWVVDPIDGTRAFLHGRKEWMISVALVQFQKPVLAVLYAPATGDYYVARAGRGAKLNGETISVSERSRLATSIMMGAPEAFHSAKFWPTPWPDTMECRYANSIAYRLCEVASGRADCCVTLRPKNDWDVAAADLVMQEAGGIMLDGDGQALEYNHRKPLHAHIMAANPKLIPKLEKRVKPALDAWRNRSSAAPI